jgi:hypothetical protein
MPAEPPDPAGYLYHEAGTTPFHATHIALHEIAHMQAPRA